MEKGTIYKDWGGRVRICLIFPNTYYVGMSNLGFLAVHHLLNAYEDIVCERAFLPAEKDLEGYRYSGTRLFALESQQSLNNFDIIAFSIPFGEDFLNVPKILKLASIPLLSKERDNSLPLIMAGGVAVSLNPEPLAELMDIFAIGEAEGFLPDFIDTFRLLHREGIRNRDEFLKELASLDGVYVPRLYNIEYLGPLIKEVRHGDRVSARVRKARARDIGRCQTPESFIITPNTEFRDTYLIEVERGCGRGCRFCATGYLYLPPRERPVDCIKESVIKGIDATGKVGLVGAAISEYSGLKEILEVVADRKGEATLSSLRLDVIDRDMLDMLRDIGYRTITIAPEAGSQRLRDVINKGITSDDIMGAVSLIRDAGFHKMKLYFMVGLPTEREEDVEAVISLVQDIRGIFRKGEISLSINPFIPKPCTPFQWLPYDGIKTLEAKLGYLKKKTKEIKRVKLKGYSPRIGYLQTILSLGDRRASRIILMGSEGGLGALIKGLDMSVDYDYIHEGRGFDEILPWDIIDHGIEKKYLWNEYQRAIQGETTPPCNVGVCTRCGICPQ